MPAQGDLNTQLGRYMGHQGDTAGCCGGSGVLVVPSVARTMATWHYLSQGDTGTTRTPDLHPFLHSMQLHGPLLVLNHL